MKPFEKVVAGPGVKPETTSRAPCVILNIEDHGRDAIDAPDGFIPGAELLKRWNANTARAEARAEARKWFAESFYANDGITIRTLRLKKGWSQMTLAEQIGTSQPHVVRIERGTENLTLNTCRRLCSALGIDMNTLDTALRRQESLMAEKSR